MMQIRRAKEKDIDRIMTLLCQVNEIHHRGRPDIFNLATKYSKEQLSGMILDSRNPIFVAADDDDVTVGYAFCVFEQILHDRMRTEIKTLYIDDLCVDEQCRGMHVGKALYEYVVEYARENGFYNVTLNVWSLNPDALRFYEAMGMNKQKIGMETIL